MVKSGAARTDKASAKTVAVGKAAKSAMTSSMAKLDGRSPSGKAPAKECVAKAADKKEGAAKAAVKALPPTPCPAGALVCVREGRGKFGLAKAVDHWVVF